MIVKVFKEENAVATYCNVTSDSNIDGTLVLEGKDEDGPWVSTWPSGQWTHIEIEEES